MALAVAPLIAVHSLAAVFGLSVLAGLALAPMISCQFSLVGALAPEGTVTEAFTWHRAATVAGMAGGSALGGSLIDTRGPGGAFALGCASVAAAALLTVLGRRRIEPAAPVEAETVTALGSGAEGPVPFALAAEAVALAADAVALAARAPAALASAIEQPRPFTLAAEAVALAAEAVAQTAAA